MSTLEDKILDGPRVHYCEDGDDDLRREEIDQEEEGENENNKVESLFTRYDDDKQQAIRYNRPTTGCSSHNTGPKGVLEDFKKKSQDDELEAEFQALMADDSFLKEYLPKRISSAMPTFGQVYRLTRDVELLDAIDKENPNALVVVHIYTKYSKPCAMLNRCLDELAADLKTTKFVTLDASVTGLSQNFKENGVPALVAYKAGKLVKSIVQLDELLDKTFNANDVKEVLSDNGLV